MRPRVWGALVLACCAGLVAASCGAAKPCPLALESQYTAALVSACADAGSLESCKAFPVIKAEHQLEQEDAGCRVK